MVQYRDVWEKRSHLLAPLSDFVAESGHTKEKKKRGTKKRPLYWNESHQKSFGLMLSKKLQHVTCYQRILTIVRSLKYTLMLLLGNQVLFFYSKFKMVVDTRFLQQKIEQHSTEILYHRIQFYDRVSLFISQKR